MTVATARSALVVLGGDETGLAVVRNAAARHLRPLVVVRPGDITTRSRLADCLVLDDTCPSGTLQMLCALASSGHRAPLVATNDRWLRFTRAYRGALDERFTVLHPSNEVLDVCLNKRRFSEWCTAHRMPTPAIVDIHIAARAGDAGKPLSPPLVLRPELSNEALSNRVPKALAVDNVDDLRSTIRRFETAASAWVATRSLLHEAREQYSVAVAVRGDTCISFVAQKLRPLPDRCAVGSYVVLRPHSGVESLARKLLHMLGFNFGVAEVEIIATASGELFVIEVNPRPWTQFALSYRSGHDFLAFLLDPLAQPRHRRRDGLAWIDVSNDLFTCFSRSTGLVRHGRLGIFDYLRSLARVRVDSTFTLNDPYPAFRRLLPLVTARRMLRPRRYTTDHNIADTEHGR